MAQIGYIQVTRICNQHCLFCSNPENGRVISFDKVKKLIKQYIADGYDGIIWTGGEPTLHPDLAKFIKYAASRNLSSKIITNAQRIADKQYLLSLVDSGLNHIHISLYSYKPKVQAFLTNNPNSLKNIKKALDNLKELSLPVAVDINTAINKYNADHLSNTVDWVIKNYPFIRHFVWNNLDPLMMQSVNKAVIPRLNDFEVELWKAVQLLRKNSKTFRIERVPLCYMDGFEHCATETRKIVKEEDRAVYFLDAKGLTMQMNWYEGGKAACCNVCSLTDICGGLYEMDKYYDSKELYPVFVDKRTVIKKIFIDRELNARQTMSALEAKRLRPQLPSAGEQIQKISGYKKKSKIKVILIGLGQQGEKYLQSLLKLDFVEIQALCCRSKETKERIRNKYKDHNFKIYQNYKICMNREDADLVIVNIAPIISQYTIVKELLLTRSAPLLVEKPVGYSVEGIFDIFKVAQEKQRCLFWNMEEMYSNAAAVLDSLFQKNSLEEVVIKRNYIHPSSDLSIHLENIHSLLEHILSYLPFWDFDSSNIEIIKKEFKPFSAFNMTFLYKNKIKIGVELRLSKRDSLDMLVKRKGVSKLISLKEENSFEKFLSVCLREAKSRKRMFFLEKKDFYLSRQLFLDKIFRGLENSAIVRPYPYCNQQCLFCNSLDEGQPDFGQMQKQLVRLKNEGVNHLVISGGEPTLYPQLFELVETAREKGFSDIEIYTNALHCADKTFVSKLKNAGLDAAFVSLHSFDHNISDGLTGCKGDLAKTLKGIKNLLAAGIKVTPNIVINKKNYRSLPGYVKNVQKTINNFDYISFSVVMPGEMALNNNLVPEYSKIAPYLLKAYAYCKTQGINFINPMCGIPVCYTPGFEDFSLEYVMLKTVANTLSEESERNQGQKIKTKKCRNCLLNDYCMGMWTSYYNLYGDKGIKPIVLPGHSFVTDFICRI